MSELTEAEHLAAVVAAINTYPPGTQVAYSVGDLAKIKGDDELTLPTSYIEVAVSERITDGERRSDGSTSETRLWRVDTRAVGDRYNNAVAMRARARVALLERALTVGTGPNARETTEIDRLASDDPIAPDDGWFSGTSEFGYAL